MTKCEKLRAWRLANPEKVAEQNRRARAKTKDDPEAKAAACARTAKWQRDNAEYLNARRRGEVGPRRPPSRILQVADCDRPAEAATTRTLRRKAVRKASGVHPDDLTGETKTGPCYNGACDYVGPLHFDHSHDNGRFRGWLCPGCNRALGIMKDSPARLRGLAEYQDLFLGTGWPREST